MGVLVTIGDARALGFCSKGARRFFADHGLNYLDFIRNGIPEEKLIDLNDAMAMQVVERAHQRLMEENGS